MTIDILNSEVVSLCAVCISDRSGGQIALMVILLSFVALGLMHWFWKKYFKKGQKSSN